MITVKEMQEHIFVYNIIPFDSLGIYLADSKEDAMEKISHEVWDNVNPTFYNQVSVNIFNAIEIWTWDEYKEMQGFNVSERLLEITH